MAEAFASALEDWPRNGCPANPEGWLFIRRPPEAHRLRTPAPYRRAAGGELRSSQRSSKRPRGRRGRHTGEIPDHRLALMFACAHPAIEASVRAPLILQVLLGLDAAMSPRHFSPRRRRWANAWCEPRQDPQGRFPFGFRSARSYRKDSARCWMRSTRSLRKGMPMRRAPKLAHGAPPVGRGHLSRPPGVQSCCRTTRGARIARADASRRVASTGAPRPARRVRSVSGAGHIALGPGDDRASRIAVA